MRRVSRSSGYHDAAAFQQKQAGSVPTGPPCFFPDFHGKDYWSAWYDVCSRCYCLQDFMAGEICQMPDGHPDSHIGSSNPDAEEAAYIWEDGLWDLAQRELGTGEVGSKMRCPECGQPKMHFVTAEDDGNEDRYECLNCDLYLNRDEFLELFAT